MARSRLDKVVDLVTDHSAQSAKTTKLDGAKCRQALAAIGAALDADFSELVRAGKDPNLSMVLKELEASRKRARARRKRKKKK